jgi:hypothetical protein
MAKVIKSGAGTAAAPLYGPLPSAFMRYYLYLSRSKVSMLYEQIPLRRSVGKTEVGVDLKYVKATRGTERTADTTHFEKLELVEEWIHRHEPVGSIDEPDAWIYGREQLIAATVRDDREFGDSEAVVFASRTQEGGVLVMQGSIVSLTSAWGSPAADTRRISCISDITVLQRRMAAMRQASVIDNVENQPRSRILGFVGEILKHPAVATCEFLAKRVHTDHTNGHPETRAMPLYVALMD